MMGEKRQIFACINKDDNIRLKSSSGGAFYLMAKWVIEQGGVVFGARFNDDWQVVHDYCDNLIDLIPLLASKYVQSKIGDSFKKAKAFLDDNRKVLFCGTPCQIAGLRNYLKKDYNNLITVDFACHGVASPGVWTEFLKTISNGREIEKISFRDKTESWLTYSFKIDFKDGSQYRKVCYDEPFMRGFLQNVYLRPSCYECNFKGLDRKSDFTIADFWGVNKAMPEMFDNKGTSIIILHTENAQNMWNDIKSEFNYKETDEKSLLASNSSLVSSVPVTEKREKFYADIKTPFIKRIDKLTKVTLSQRVKGKVKSILHM